MSEWDSAASERLEQVAADLREAGVVEVFAQQVRATWSANLARYEPRELGDTPQLLGLLCAGNLAQRVARRYAEPRPMERPIGSVRASLPDGSLLVEACGVELQARKAPGEALKPEWSAFTWEESSGVRRHAAAAANSATYRPERSDQDGRPPTLPGDGALWSLGNPNLLRHVVLVWAGIPDGALTSGWLGIPSIGSLAWLAVTQLWWDTAGEDPGARRHSPDDGPTSGGDTFADRPVPKLGLRPRPQPQEDEQA